MMRLSSVITVLLAVVLAGAAGFMAQQWLEDQRRLALPAVHRTAPEATIVVASRPLRFGTELSKVNLQEISWPAGSLPPGAFATISDIIKQGERRLVLAPIELNEPVLAAKITGPGQRATLSSLIGEGMKAITIRVNDVNGVAGFVLPGDRIDVMLTRKVNDTANVDLATEVLLQDVRVLGIDQNADERQDKAILVKAVTVEVTIDDAQRVVLASSIGSLSLALRAAGSSGRDATGRITPSDLTGSRPSQPPVTTSEMAPVTQRAEEPVEKLDRSLRPFGVTRSVNRIEYSVPSDEQSSADRSRAPVRLKRATPAEPGKSGVEGGTGVPNKQPGPNSKGPGTAPQSWLNSWSVRTMPAPLTAPTPPLR